MTASLRIKILDILQWVGFAIVLVALPFSNFFISLGSFWLVGVWLLNLLNAHFTDRSAKEYFKDFLQNKAYHSTTLIFMLPLFGLLWTEDFKFGAWDLRTKLPLLFMPLLVSTLRPMSARAVEGLLAMFVSALGVAALICIGVYFGLSKKPILNIRDISIFISHIRFSMLLVFGAAVILLRWLKHGRWIVPSVLLLLIYFSFIWLIESLTGVTLLVMTGFILAFFFLSSRENKVLKWTLPVLVFSACLGGGVFVVNAYHRYFKTEEIDKNALENFSPRGAPYIHHKESSMVENGNLIYYYLCWDEMPAAWNKRSEIAFDSLDNKGNLIKWTLIRYLTSKGLRKDMDGVNALTEGDIENIEKGIPNYAYFEQSGLTKRLNKVFFEYDNYRNGGSPNGHSVFQRLEFWKTGWSIFSENLMFGVGTGDLKKSFKEQYNRHHTKLEEKNQLRAHNQFLTFFITYGVVGGVLFLLFFFYPLVFKSIRSNPYYVVLIVIYAISFFTEDTLETQVGVTFYAFFHPFILRFIKPNKEV
jgi:hypothetical protein